MQSVSGAIAIAGAPQSAPKRQKVIAFFLPHLTVLEDIIFEICESALYAGYRILGEVIGKTAVFAKTNVCEQYTRFAGPEKSPTA